MDWRRTIIGGFWFVREGRHRTAWIGYVSPQVGPLAPRSTKQQSRAIGSATPKASVITVLFGVRLPGALGNIWEPDAFGATPSGSRNVASSIKLADRRLAYTIFGGSEFVARNPCGVRFRMGDRACGEGQHRQDAQGSLRHAAILRCFSRCLIYIGWRKRAYSHSELIPRDHASAECGPCNVRRNCLQNSCSGIQRNLSAWENQTEMIMPFPGIETHVLILAQYSRAIAGPGVAGLRARLGSSQATSS